MDNYFNLENLKNEDIPEDLAKRVVLIYNLLNPMRALDVKYEKEILPIHNEFTASLVNQLKEVKTWQDYSDFMDEQMVSEERSRLKICAIMHPSKRKEKGLPAYNEAQIENVSNMWGTALRYLLQSEYSFIKLKMQDLENFTKLSVGDSANLVGLNSFTENFYAGCDWAIADNEKVAKNIESTMDIKTDYSFQQFVDECGFDFIRYPIIHDNTKSIFLSYLDICSDIMTKEYGISKTKLGFNQNGLELCTTNSPAYYMPSTKAISLRLDMINAFYHEHFHALDHQVLLGIDTKQIDSMFGVRGSMEYSLASEIKIIDPSKITDSASKNILLDFNKSSQSFVAALDENNKEVVFSEQEQQERKEKIVSMTKRFLEEIYQKLELDSTPFTPVIEDIMKDFVEIKSSSDFEDTMDKKLSTLVGEKFEEKHKNHYVLMTQRIHNLYNKINNKTLYYNFSLINDGGKEKYFATKPEMLARSAESFFFQKYPKTNITPPEWWENNSYLFYPQGEEKDLIYKNFTNVINSIKANSAAFEDSLGKKNIKKTYRL